MGDRVDGDAVGDDETVLDHEHKARNGRAERNDELDHPCPRLRKRLGYVQIVEVQAVEAARGESARLRHHQPPPFLAARIDVFLVVPTFDRSKRPRGRYRLGVVAPALHCAHREVGKDEDAPVVQSRQDTRSSRRGAVRSGDGIHRGEIEVGEERRLEAEATEDGRPAAGAPQRA